MNVFLSYPSEKEAEARSIYNLLRSFGLEVWFDKESLIGGQDWDRERILAQKSADLTVLLCSQETVQKSGVIQREVKEVLRIIEDKPHGHLHLLCVRLEEVLLPPELTKYQYIDYFKPDFQKRILQTVKAKFSQMGVDVTNEIKSLETGSTVTKTLSYGDKSIVMDATYFQYNLTSEYWQYINSEIISEVYGGYYQNLGFLGFHAKDRPELTEYNRKLEWFLRVEEKFRHDELVSIAFSYYVDSGGAHGNHGTHFRNFNGSSYGKFTLNDLFGFDSDVLSYLKKYCEIDIKRQHIGYDDDINIEWQGEDYTHWNYFDNFSFDSNNLIIHFNPYDILAYAYGDQVINIPWSYFKRKISDQFRDTPIAHLISGAPD